MSKQTDAVDAVREFLWRTGTNREAVLTVDHPHNGRVTLEAGYLWDLIAFVERASDAWHPGGHGTGTEKV